MNTVNASTPTQCASALRVLGQALRGALAVGILALLGWAAVFAPGCVGHGKHTAEHLSAAKTKMEAMKSATEYKMAEQAFLGNDLPKALKHIDYSISLNEKVARSHVLRGRTFMEMGDLESAAACFTHALELDPKI